MCLINVTTYPYNLKYVNTTKINNFLREYLILILLTLSVDRKFYSKYKTTTLKKYTGCFIKQLKNPKRFFMSC